jgi:hypothetical protein
MRQLGCMFPCSVLCTAFDELLDLIYSSMYTLLGCVSFVSDAWPTQPEVLLYFPVSLS